MMAGEIDGDEMLTEGTSDKSASSMRTKSHVP